MKQGAAADTGVAPESASFQPQSVAEVAKLFPQLEIISLIGKGGMGAVYQARQPGLDRIVALKILPPQTAGGPGFVERFNREARALAKLNHPNIVAVYEFGQVNGLPYFIMEYVDGLNLRELERAGKLSPREALQIVPQICEALQFAHDEGIVHRDIKPENILVDKKGRIKIADFGIAKILSGAPQVDLTGTQGTLGTPHYMAPEQMEKPTMVDHRADIFSLGVVFYEMLTGELPLGKFAPPSSRKVEVDVRLDDVVLRALEKDPDRRYQHASQVKTAVNDIAGSAAPPPTSTVSGAALAEEILAKDYKLNIRSCVKRGWRLLKGEFWPIVGITALFVALFAVASSVGGSSMQRNSGGQSSVEFGSAVALLVWGPLMGGLLLYYLKKIRMESTTVELAFCGFGSGHRFLHLFLAGFVTGLLTWLGFLCLILPGIYLLVAWMFTLPLVIDKQLDFWSAMELSRKVVTKHWFKFLGFAIVLLLLYFAGLLMLIVGVFVMMPIILAALMYAYEDIFGKVTGVAPAAPSGTGPSGTIVMPPAAFAEPPRAGSGLWTPATQIGLAAVAVVIAVFLTMLATHHQNPIHALSHRHVQVQSEDEPQAVEPVPPDMPAPPAAPAPMPAAALGVDAVNADTSIQTNLNVTFGAVTEEELTNFETIRIRPASSQKDLLPESIAEQNRGPDRDSAACTWMEGADMDFAYIGAYDGFYGMTRDMANLRHSDWDNISPESLVGLLHDAGQDIEGKFGDSSRLNNPTNYTYGFKTRDGSVGLLQVTAFTENPDGVTIRYKLVQPATNSVAQAKSMRNGEIREQLLERLDAASGISDGNRKDGPLKVIAMDAAKAGQVEIAQKALGQMFEITQRDAGTRETCLLLAKHGLRKQAVEMAKGITDYNVRNQTLTDLAQ
jgi:predicted Ser/Thr protein kinase